jgi:alkaline phosphatase
MSLGYAESEYVLRPQYLQRQTMSFTKFNDTYIPMYKQNKPSFDAVLEDIAKIFGLIAPSKATSGSDRNLIMTQAEYQQLKTAYQNTLLNKSSLTDYGSYEPLTVTANQILNHHIGIGFTSYVHTATLLPLYALGAGAQAFTGQYLNTQIYARLVNLMELPSNK